jgi:RNA polymerase sigma-70 factor (ECF subfamily)
MQIIGEFYKRYGHLVFGASMKFMKNKFDAEDITMSVFEALPNKIAKHDIRNFKPWLYQVTKNQCLMFLRRTGRLTTEVSKELQAEDQLQYKIVKEGQLNIMEAEIETLNDEQRSCIKLFYLEQKSYHEISDILEMDIKKVKSSIQNGKRNLKIKLEGRNEFK